MSSVAIPLYHYAILKGYLAGQNAPSEVLAAVEALHMAAVQGPLRADALDAIQAVKEAAERLAGMASASQSVEMSIAKPELSSRMPEAAEPELPPLTKRALEQAAERADRPMGSDKPQTDEAKIAAFIEARAVEQCPPAHATGEAHEVIVGPSEPKKRREWTPEQREAAAQRMRDRQAAGLMGRRKKEPAPEPAATSEPSKPPFEIRKASLPQPAPKPKSSPTIDPTRLITVHNGYAGKRQGGRLLDEDWPDIKSRLAKAETKAAIAGDYEVEVEDLEYFVASCQRRESKKPPGEARALL